MERIFQPIEKGNSCSTNHTSSNTGIYCGVRPAGLAGGHQP